MEDVATIHKNFHVACGQKKTETIEFSNTSKVARTYVIVKRKGPEIWDERLQICPLQVIAAPGRTIRFTITYLSYIENVVDNFLFDILDCSKIVAHLVIRAQSVGPCLNVVSYDIKFFRFRDVAITAKLVDIVNTTKCSAKYYFDIDEDNKLVQISQPYGVIPPNTKLNLKLTFNPPEPGVFHKQIFCLVQFHKPIVFNIVGVHRPKLRCEPKNLTFSFPPQKSFSNGYEAYMGKLVFWKLLPEPERSSFMRRCIEENEICLNDLENREDWDEEKKFWKFSLDNESDLSTKNSVKRYSNEVILTTHFADVKSMSEIPKATTLANLSQAEIFFYQWDHDPRNHFQVESCRGVLEPDKRVDFTIYFTPSAPDVLYHIEFDVRLFLCNCPEAEDNSPQPVNLPLTLSFRIIGHSFPDDSFGWVPQCAVVPKTLQLPTCVPEEIVYGTFCIERQGHLPVTFNVVSQKDSNYMVQPTLGYFSAEFQLFVVQFNGKSKDKGIYKEDLKILYNNSELNCDIVKLTTLVELPKIIFGTGNIYSFKCVFPGSKTTGKALLENPTGLSLCYEFKIPEDITWVEFPESKGYLEPMSVTKVEVLFKPEIPCEYLDYIPCFVSSTSMMEYSIVTNVQLKGSCQYGYIVATPSIYDFGECVCCSEKSVKTFLYNFSPVQLYFRLFAIHRAFPVGEPKRDVQIKPSRGKIYGKSCLEVEVTITPNGKDVFQYAIICEILENGANDALPCEEGRVIFSFRFEGVLPAAQIIDINIDGGGPLFSPDWIWKMLSVNRLNQFLNSLKPEEEIEVKLPEVMIKSKPITIALLFEANRFGDVPMSFHKEILCTCLDSPDTQHVCNHQKECRHNGVMIITPNSVLIAPKKRQILHMVLTYHNLEECRIVLTISLAYGRKLILKSLLVSLPNDEPACTSTYLLPTFCMQPVYVGDPEPPRQLFWLYNNTDRPTSYIVDKVTLREATVFVHRIFDCCNPNGVIPPFSCVPLTFLFKPKEIISYVVEILLCLKENKLIPVRIQGEGIPYIQQFECLGLKKTVPEKPILYNSGIAVECSINLINIRFFKTFSTIKRIFSICNRSYTDTWAYEWHDFKIQSHISACVEPKKGLLEPNEEITLTLVLQSFCQSSILSISIPCDVINYSLLKSFESTRKYSEFQTAKAKECFTITENGLSYEVPNIVIPKKPEVHHLFVTVNVNIFNVLNIDQKLTLQQQLTLEAGEELKLKNNLEPMKNLSVLPSLRQFLEKTIWDILNSKIFANKIGNLQYAHDFCYLQLLPDSKHMKEEVSERLLPSPSQNYVQSFLEDTLLHILRKALTSDDILQSYIFKKFDE